MKKMSEFCEQIGMSAVDVQNWLSRLELRTVYAPTVAGSARRFSAENVVELALISAFARVGVPPQAGVALADMTVRNFRSGHKIREWAVIAAGNFSTGRMADDLSEISFDAMTRDQPDDMPVFSVVRVGELVRRITKIFAEA